MSNVNKKPYQLLTYSSGLGHESYNATAAINDHRNAYHKATIPSTWANHAGDDVPLYAVGALANLLFSGTLDQTYIPHAIAFAMCLEDFQDRCRRQFFERKVEMMREKKPSKIHLLKQKLQEDAFEERQGKIDNIEVVSEDFFIEFTHQTDIFSTSFVNSTDTEEDEVMSTADLIGNSTLEDSGQCTLSNSFMLLVVLLLFVGEL